MEIKQVTSEIQSYIKSIIKKKSLESNVENPDTGFEIYLLSDKSAISVRIVAMEVPFIIFTIERKEFDFYLSDFESIFQIKQLLLSFLEGDYRCKVIGGVLSAIYWNDTTLTKFNRIFNEYDENDTILEEGVKWW